MNHQYTLESLESRRLLSAVITPLLTDGFDGSSVNFSNWHIPAYDPNGSTYLGRTQLRVSQNSAAPKVSGGAVHLTLDSYNPTSLAGNPSFYGTELISNQTYSVGTGLDIVVRAKFNGPIPGGIVGGIFTYALKPGGVNHDEIDTELLSNALRNVQSNVYANEPLGAGTPLFSTLARGNDETLYHTYEMTCTPGEVDWYVDGRLVRTDKSRVPAGPMAVYLNIWAPDQGWANAYNSAIGPTAKARHNQQFGMDIDSVAIRSVRVRRGSAASAVQSAAAMNTVVPAMAIVPGGALPSVDAFGAIDGAEGTWDVLIYG